jgi:hypothetical protein
VGRIYSEFAIPEGLAKVNRLERETGIEPATSGLGSLRSTAELLPPDESITDGEPFSKLARQQQRRKDNQAAAFSLLRISSQHHLGSA